MPAQLAKHERRRHVLRRVAEVGAMQSSSSQPPANAPPSASLETHHHIATTRNNPVDIFAILRENEGDPALKVESHLFGGMV
jgi:hypothetical protein